MVDKAGAFVNISKLSDEMKASISDLFWNGGILKAESVMVICAELSISVEELMLLLLPVAESFARAPISSFNVGAIVKGLDKNQDGYANLYLGANFEYKNLSLNFSIHAEQSAVSNAWLNGETKIESIATSAAPCGHCRQFLYELSGTNPLPVIMPMAQSEGMNIVDIQSLLPSAFGPKHLGCNQLLMQATTNSKPLLLNNSIDEELVMRTLKQAKLSYAPYTGNYAACGIELNNGLIFFGRYAENVAHNPSLSAFSSAVSQIAMSRPDKQIFSEIKRVVFVEKYTLSSQKEYAKLLLANLANSVELEYHQANF